MTGSIKDEGAEANVRKAATTPERAGNTCGKTGTRRLSWAAAAVVSVIISAICSVSAIAVYDRFVAQKVVTANISRFVLDQRDLYFEGKIDRQQYINNLNNFIALLKSQPRNRVVILEDVVAANAEKLEPR